MKTQINEIKRMQQLAGIINEVFEDPRDYGDPRYDVEPEYYTANKIEYEVKALNDEIAIVKSKIDGALYAFWFFDDKQDMEPYGLDYKDNADVVENYLNDNLRTISKGTGLNDWESGKQLVKIDDELKADLLGTFGLDEYIAKALA